MSHRLLLVEDHPDIVEIVQFNLSRKGYLLEVARDGKEGLEKALSGGFSLLLLDIMLPKMSGLDLLRLLRRESSTKDLPVILLTAKSSEEDIVTGLQAGADDYVTKPFSPNELLARVEAVLRRAGRGAAPASSLLKMENLEVNLDKHEAKLEGEVLQLTKTEFRLLAFMSLPGRVFTRDQLIDKVAGPSVTIIDRNIDVHVSSLRKKLGTRGEWIITIRGVGYRFRE